MTPRRAAKPAMANTAIDQLVETYSSHQDKLSMFLGSLRETLTGSRELSPFIHSVKWRMKDPTHLRDKLERKASRAAAAGEIFDITPDNLFVRINDLVGFRILHLYTRQMEQIHPILLELLEENMMAPVESPAARTWDDESRQFFQSLGIATVQSESLYTSVHYVIGSHSRTRYTAEIQVRTLAEELWGEVDHSINYPHPSPLLACQEQIKVLARVTSSCTRLVDSIFRAHEESSAKRTAKRVKNATGDSPAASVRVSGQPAKRRRQRLSSEEPTPSPESETASSASRRSLSNSSTDPATSTSTESTSSDI